MGIHSFHPVPSAAIPLPDESLPPTHLSAITGSLAGSTNPPPVKLRNRSLSRSPTRSRSNPLGASSSASAAAASSSSSVPPTSYTTQLSDLLLSAVVPGIPKSNPNAASAQKSSSTATFSSTRPPLTSKAVDLNLTTTTQNFRAFVIKIGWIFWIQDRVEEVVFWRRADRSAVFILVWGIVSFYPRLLIFLPILATLAVSVVGYQDKQRIEAIVTASAAEKKSLRERRRKSSSGILEEFSPSVELFDNDDDVFGSSSLPPRSSSSFSIGTLGRSNSISSIAGRPSSGHAPRANSISGTSITADQPTLPPHASKTAIVEPQGLSKTYYQNIQGIQNLMGLFAVGYDIVAPYTPHLSTPPAVLVLSVFTLTLVITLPYIPLPAILLPIGWLPLLPFSPIFFYFPPTSLLQKKIKLQIANSHLQILTDLIPVSQRSLPLRTLSVFENQRLLPPNNYTAIALRLGERGAWTARDGAPLVPNTLDDQIQPLSVGGLDDVELDDGWEWVISEAWNIDWVGSWIPEDDVDLDGWSYSDDLWQAGGGGEKVTRRRRWWRRAVQVNAREGP